MNDTNDRYRNEHAPALPTPVATTPPVIVNRVRELCPVNLTKCKQIYIAIDGGGETIGIVLANTPEVAHAYFVGLGEMPHTMKVIDPTDDNLGVMGLVTIFKTHKIHFWKVKDSNPEKIRLENRS